MQNHFAFFFNFSSTSILCSMLCFLKAATFTCWLFFTACSTLGIMSGYCFSIAVNINTSCSSLALITPMLENSSPLILPVNITTHCALSTSATIFNRSCFDKYILKKFELIFIPAPFLFSNIIAQMMKLAKCL